MELYAPAPLLKPFVHSYCFIETAGERVNRVLPGVNLVMAFRYKGSVQYLQDKAAYALPPAAFSGMRKSVRLIHYADNTANLLVQFHTGGAAAFFNAPLHEVFEDSISLDSLVRARELQLLEEQLGAAADNAQRVRIMDEFLLCRFREVKPDALVLSAVEQIHATNGNIKIKELAAGLYISQDAFEKRFRRVAGASPKQFASIVRMRSVIFAGPQHLASAAFDAGYFDLPHFNKDFKIFTGLTPTDFFKTPSFW